MNRRRLKTDEQERKRSESQVRLQKLIEWLRECREQVQRNVEQARDNLKRADEKRKDNKDVSQL